MGWVEERRVERQPALQPYRAGRIERDAVGAGGLEKRRIELLPGRRLLFRDHAGGVQDRSDLRFGVLSGTEAWRSKVPGDGACERIGSTGRSDSGLRI